MQRDARAKVASIGVTRTKLAVEEQLGWLFREQATEDYGIDAHIEVVDEQMVGGRLLALQIKSGESWFCDHAPGGWWFRPDEKHVRYWTNHSLPVVIVLYRPETERCHWQLVNSNTLESTANGGWKLLVPETHVLTRGSAPTLRSAADGDPYMLRIRELRLARSWMRLLANGNRLVIEIEEWINKLSGRGSIVLGIDYEDGNPPAPLANWTVMVRGPRWDEQLSDLVPWAHVGLHDETYEEAEFDLYEEECVRDIGEGDRIVIENFDDWRRRKQAAGLRPYTVDCDEVARWRLELTLNDLGRAFMLVDNFGLTGGQSLTGYLEA